MSDTDTNLESLKELVRQFRKERDWDKHFTPKDTAISISLEANELLEHFQWDRLIKEDRAELASELADVLIFSFHFATLYNFDISTIFQDKLAQAAKKYPPELFANGADGQADYHRIKREHRQKGTT